MNLKEKVVLITGGGRGIGREAALTCAQEGAKVVISARSETELKETADFIESKTSQKVATFRCDVSKTSEVEELINRTEKEVGPIYGLVCAAAIYGPKGLLEDQSLLEWEQALNINVMGTVRCLHATLPLMKKRQEGRVILFSGGGEGKFPRFSSYVASKGAIWRLTETLAAETIDDGIFVNAVAPGAVNTRLMEEVLQEPPEKVGKEFYEKTLKQRDSGGVSAGKAADLIVYLLGERSKGLSGKVLSALWDPYDSFKDLETLTRSDLYNFRRVTSLEV